MTKRRPELRRIYQEWCRHNLRQHSLQVLGISFFVIILLAMCDFFIFGREALFYLPWRIICAAILGCLFTLGRAISFRPEDRRFHLLASFMFGLGLTAWNGIYFYFYLYGPEPHRQMVIAAIYMNIFISHYFVQRFWKLQYIVTALFLIALAMVSNKWPERRLDVTSFILWVVSVFIICWVQRRAFCSALLLKYESLRNQFPAKMARVICTESASYTLREAFKPAVRPCACICLDWRSFQAYVSSQPPEVVAQQIQTVHDTVLTILNESIHDESYFADWTADEIFITIYSDTNDLDAVLENTWAFCHSFQKNIRARLIEEIGAKAPVIDIGAAVGTGLVGLVGPTAMKKTTIVGAIAGIAKRLESVAKQLRETSPSSATPILCVNKALYNFIQGKQPKFAAAMRPMQSEIKDLLGVSIYVYSETLSRAPAMNPLPKAANFH